MTVALFFHPPISYGNVGWFSLSLGWFTFFLFAITNNASVNVIVHVALHNLQKSFYLYV